MSAAATIAVAEHATGTDGEKLMLFVLAEEANSAGIIADVDTEQLATAMGKKARSASQIKRGLIASGQLVVLQEESRTQAAIYWLKLPGLTGPSDVLNEQITQAAETPNASKGRAKPAPSPSAPVSEQPAKSKEGKEKQFRTLVLESGVFSDGLPLDALPEVVADGLEFLRTGEKVNRHMVTPYEMAIAAAAIHAFNRCFEWKRPDGELVKGSEYGLGANLTPIVMCVRKRPSWDAAKHVRLVESAWRIRWWENGDASRRPTPKVIYGGGAFENVAQDAAEEAEGVAVAEIKKRRYTRG